MFIVKNMCLYSGGIIFGSARVSESGGLIFGGLIYGVYGTLIEKQSSPAQ